MELPLTTATKSDSPNRPSNELRARVVRGGAVMVAVSAAAGEVARGAAGGPLPIVGVFTCVAALGCAVAGLWLLRRPGSVARAGMLAVLGAVLGIVPVAAFEGGLRHPSLMALPILPIFAVYVAGRRTGWWVAGVAAAVYAAFGAAALLGVEPPALPGGHAVNVFLHVAIALAICGVSLGLALVYSREVEREHAMLREHAEALALSRDAAMSAVRAKSAFLATMSHELRTPLTGVIGNAELIALDTRDPQLRPRLDTIERSGRLLLEIINNVLDFSKIEAGELVLTPQPVDVAREIRVIMEMMRPLADARGLELREDLELRAAVQILDGLRLRQVLLNLIGNAIKFTPAGHVEVRARCVPGTGDECTLVCEVADTGPGIPSGRRADVFQPFAQLDAGIARVHEGTGLGLAISAQLCELMGGTLVVEERPGGGALFRVELATRVDKSQAPREITEQHDLPFEPRGRVLVVDDNVVNREVVGALLGKLGYRDITRVESGASAVLAAQSARYDIVLMDMQMPEMDGIEATRLLLALPMGVRPAQVVGLSANSGHADREACLEAGMVEFLTKPVSLEVLLRTMRRAERRLRATASER